LQASADIVSEPGPIHDGLDEAVKRTHVIRKKSGQIGTPLLRCCSDIPFKKIGTFVQNVLRSLGNFYTDVSFNGKLLL